MPNLATSLDAALAELATDPIAVLRASGVRGRKNACSWCPVAEFVRLRLGSWPVSVGAGHITVETTLESVTARLPLNVIAAIREIDAGKHPELCV